MAPDSQCRQNYEVGSPRERKNCKGGQGMHARMRVRVHQFHHERSIGEVSTGEEENSQWGRYSLRNDFVGIRELFRSLENLFGPLSRDGNHETLLANQKSTGPTGTAGGGTNSSAAGANASPAATFAEGPNDAILGDGLDDATTGYDPSFAAVHNGNGTAEY